MSDRVWRLIRPLAALAVVLAVAAAGAGVARGGYVYLHSCAYFNDGGGGFNEQSNGSFLPGNRCAQGGSFQLDTASPPAGGDKGQWVTVTPPSIQIVAAFTPLNQVLVNPSLRNYNLAASFFWEGGSQAVTPAGSCCGGMDYGLGINRSIPPSRFFGWQVSCPPAGGCGEPAQTLDVRGIALQGVDNTPPTDVALGGSSNLWSAGGHWVRGRWSAAYQASDDSGICASDVTFGGQLVPASATADTTPNTASWTQCPGMVSPSPAVDTSGFTSGPQSLQFRATDAAGNQIPPGSDSTTVYVDNQPVNLALSGPADAPSTAGVQYVTASATAGPSSVAGIACALDGAPYRWSSGPSVRVPVEGVGQHQLSCYAENNAVDVQGAPARSATETWSLAIRRPTLMSASFARMVDALQCVRRREHVLVPAHWVTASSHGNPVRVRVPAREERVTVVHCRPRLIRRRLRVHGRWEVIRVPVFPHVVQKTVERIGFGQRTTVSGWLGLSDGTALSGQTVRILAAPDDGSGRFTDTASSATGSDGTWSATLPTGPSRLVEALYGGSATTEPVGSADVRIAVPARVRLRVVPTRVRWGSRITISGRLDGGYIPVSKTAVSQLLRLRIGVQGVSETAGIPDLKRDGRFRTSYCFNPGRGVAHFWFSASTLNEADYPFAPAGSRRAEVTVGPNTAAHPC